MSIVRSRIGDRMLRAGTEQRGYGMESNLLLLLMQQPTQTHNTLKLTTNLVLSIELPILRRRIRA